jgi:dipeptidyl aminopeptidase/acylaminoacyl peptidase
MQPTYAPDGTLYFALEVDGFWTLHRLGAKGVERVTSLKSELGAPLWQLGATHWAFVDARTVAAIHFDRGRARLSLIDVTSGEVRFIAESLPYLGQLVVDGRNVIVATGWSGASGELVRVSTDTGATRTLVNAHAGLLDPADVSSPEPVEFPTSHGETAHGFYYAPRNQRFSAPDGTLPPLLVVVHGGPTASTSTAFSPTVQFFTTRGFAVLDVNYRGSSGYGRAYRDRLRGEWGVLDVDDCLAGARYLAERGRVDGKRLLIRGGSAGGYTVLRALEGDSVFAAGACHYGISDLEALTRDTHKFESRYDRFLVGSYPEQRDVFVERSPIHHVERIARPVVFFQGLDDKVVPANQTELMANALRARGIPAEYYGYEGEQHGFRKAETIRHVLETELEFFRRVLGLG